jgi:hypothetical protein
MRWWENLGDLRYLLILGGVIGFVIIVILLGVFVYFCWYKKRGIIPYQPAVDPHPQVSPLLHSFDNEL